MILFIRSTLFFLLRCLKACHSHTIRVGQLEGADHDNLGITFSDARHTIRFSAPAPIELSSSMYEKYENPPKYVLWSGYQLPREDFKRFALSIPGVEPKQVEYFAGDVSAYSAWVIKNFPAEARSHLPKCRFHYLEPRTDPFQPASHIFFPLRFIENRERRTLDDQHPEIEWLRKETEKDRKDFGRFAEYLMSQGATLDLRQAATFGCMEDLHPRLFTDEP